MESFNPEQNSSLPNAGVPPLPTPLDSPLVDAQQYETAYNESLAQTLDLNNWRLGEELSAHYERLAQEVEEAIRQETELLQRVRDVVFGLIQSSPNSPPQAGVYQATLKEIQDVHQAWLFTGQVEACDGTSAIYDTLPLTVTQLGACLVSYRGDQGSWGYRMYRRDLRNRGGDPVDEALQLLDRRWRREGFEQESQRDTLTSLARRGIMAYAERAALLHKSTAPWRMGQGNPAPFELLTGSGYPELAERSLVLLRELLLGHQRFVFVPSAPAARHWLTIGDALRPLEYAIVDTLTQQMEQVKAGHYRGAWRYLLPRLDQFIAEVGPKVVIGLYRASTIAPAQLFYAHADHAHHAALVAMADSVLEEHRGFPLLLHLADTLCRNTFGAETFNAYTQLAYSETGKPFRYFTERQTR